MKLKTFILTFLLMIMSSPIVFGQNRAGETAVATADDLQQAISQSISESKEIRVYLRNSIHVAKQIDVSAGAQLWLDLNGFELSSPQSVYVFKNYGNLTITDNATYGGGKVVSRGIANGSDAKEGTLTIDGGTFEHNGDGGAALYNYAKGTATISGGTFIGGDIATGTTPAIINKGIMSITNAVIKEKNIGDGGKTITCFEGSTLNFPDYSITDPTDPSGTTTRPVSPHTFIYGGAIKVNAGATLDGDELEKNVMYVKSEVGSLPFGSLQDAVYAVVNNEGTIIQQLYDEEINATITIPSSIEEIIINGNDKTLKVGKNSALLPNNFQAQVAFLVKANNTTFNSLTVIPNDKQDGSKDTHVLYLQKGDKAAEAVTIKDCHFEGWSAVLVGQPGVVINITDSELVGENTDPANTSLGTISLLDGANNVEVTMNGDSSSITAKSGEGMKTQSAIHYSENATSSLAGSKFFIDAKINVEGENARYVGFYGTTADPQAIVRNDYAGKLLEEGWITTQVDDKMVQIKGIAVAKIGETRYATIAEAYAEVKTDETIEIIDDDITLAQAPTLEYIYGTTGNAERFTITVKEGLTFTTAPNLSFKGVEVILNAPTNCAELTVGESATLNVNADLTANGNVTVDGKLNANANVINVTPEHTVTVNNELNVNKGTFTARHSVTVNGKLNVNAGKFNQPTGGVSLFLGDGAEIMVAEGAEFIGVNAKQSSNEHKATLIFNGNATFKKSEGIGGTIDLTMMVKGAKFTTPEIANADLNTYTDDENYKIIYENGAYTVVDLLGEDDVVVNQTRGIGYRTLAAAIAEVENDDILVIKKAGEEPAGVEYSEGKSFTIKEGENAGYKVTSLTISQGTTVTLDGVKCIQTLSANSNAVFNIKGETSLTNVKGNNENGVNLLDGASLTIKNINTPINVTGEVVIKHTGTCAYPIILNGATLADGTELNSNTILEAKGESDVIDSKLTAASITVAEDATLNVNANVTLEGTVVVNGTLNTEADVVVGTAVTVDGTLNVNDGIFKQYKKTYALNLGKNALINVAKDAEFNGGNAKVAADTEVNLNFEGKASFNTSENINGTINLHMVEGVIFKTPEITNGTLNPTNIAYGRKVVYDTDHYKVVPNDNGEFVVLRKAVVGTEIGYNTLQDAINAYEENDVIVLRPKYVEVDDTNNPIMGEDGNPKTDDDGNQLYNKKDELASSVDMFDTYVCGKDVTITTDDKEVMVNWVGSNANTSYLCVGHCNSTGENDGDATLIFDNANIKSATTSGSTQAGLHISGAERPDAAADVDAKQSMFNGTVIVRNNSKIEVDFISLNNEMTIEEGCTVIAPMGIEVAGVPSTVSTVEHQEIEGEFIDATATLTIEEGAILSVTNSVYAGIGKKEGDYGFGKMYVKGTFENSGNFIVGTKGTMNIENGTANIGNIGGGENERLLNSGTIIITGVSTFNAVAMGGSPVNPVQVQNATLKEDSKWIGEFATVDFSGENYVKGSSFRGGKINVVKDAVLNLEGNVTGGTKVNVLEDATIYMPVDPETTFTTSDASLEGVITTDKDYKVYYDGTRYVVVEVNCPFDNVTVYDGTTTIGYRTLADALTNVKDGDIVTIIGKGTTNDGGVIETTEEEGFTYTGTATNFTITANADANYVVKYLNIDNATVNFENIYNTIRALTVDTKDATAETSVANISGNVNITTIGGKGTFNLVEAGKGKNENPTVFTTKNVGANVNASGKIDIVKTEKGDSAGTFFMHNVTLGENTEINGGKVVFNNGENDVKNARMNVGDFTVNEGAIVNLNDSYVQTVTATLNDNSVLYVNGCAKADGGGNSFYVTSGLDIRNDVKITIENSILNVYVKVYANGKPSLNLINRVEDGVEIDETAKFISMETFNHVDATDDTHKIIYKDGAYIAVSAIQEGIDAVAIKGTDDYPTQGYPTLKEALEVAAGMEGDVTIMLLSSYKQPIDMQGAILGKNVTITGDEEGYTYQADWSNGYLYIGRASDVTEGVVNTTLTFKDVKIENQSSLNSSYSIFVSNNDCGDLYFNGTLVFDGSEVTTNIIENNYEVKLINESSVTVDKAYKSSSSYENVITIDNSSFVSDADLTISEKGTVNINGGTFTVESDDAQNNFNLTNNGTVNVSGIATVAALDVQGEGTFNFENVTLDRNTKIVSSNNTTNRFNFIQKPATGGTKDEVTCNNEVKGSQLKGNALIIDEGVSVLFTYETYTNGTVTQYQDASLNFASVTNDGTTQIVANDDATNVILTTTGDIANNGTFNLAGKIVVYSSFVNDGKVNFIKNAVVAITDRLSNNTTGEITVTNSTQIDSEIYNEGTFTVKADLIVVGNIHNGTDTNASAQFNVTNAFVEVPTDGTTFYNNAQFKVTGTSDFKAVLMGDKPYNFENVTLSDETILSTQSLPNDVEIRFEGDKNTIVSSQFTYVGVYFDGGTNTVEGSENALVLFDLNDVFFVATGAILNLNNSYVTINATLNNFGTLNILDDIEVSGINNGSDKGIINISAGKVLTVTDDKPVNVGSIYLNKESKMTVVEFTAPDNNEPEMDPSLTKFWEVVYDNGSYVAKEIRYVATIGDNYYHTLQEAIDAADATGTTITLITPADKTSVSMDAVIEGKDITITTGGEEVDVDWDNGVFFVGRDLDGTHDGSGDATLTFDNAKLVYAQSTTTNSDYKGLNISGTHKDFSHVCNGTVKVVNKSSIQVNYIIIRNEMIIDDSEVIVKGENAFNSSTSGKLCNVHIGGRNSNETYLGYATTATLTLSGNSTLQADHYIETRPSDGYGYALINVGAGSTVIAKSIGIQPSSSLKSEGNIFTESIMTEERQGLIELKGGVYNHDVNDFCHSDYTPYPCSYNVTLPTGYPIAFYAVRESNGSQTFKLNGGDPNEGKGWNWISSYINPIDFNLSTLQAGLGNVGTIIQSQLSGFAYCYNGVWSGASMTLANTTMYKVQVTEDISFELEGDYVNYPNEKIVLVHGWNWIGYPVSTPMYLEDAFPTPLEGDAIKTNKVNEYGVAIGTMALNLGGTEAEWFDDQIILEPGCGYMYYNSGDTREFTYPTVVNTTTDSNRATKEANRWSAPSGYASNMTMFAVVNIDGELVDGNYEVAAFANGEVRGSARPVYIESLDAYALFMIIAGDKVEELTFKYYDVNYGTEYELDNRINYSSDAIVGSFDEPYILTMNITDVEEVTLSDINIYPNPTTTGVKVNLDATCEKVEIFNALGAKVAEYQNVDSIDAFETAGIYVIRLTNNGEIKHTRLVVK